MVGVLNPAKIVIGESLKRIRFRLTEVDPDTGRRVALDLTGCTLEAKYSIDGGTEKIETLSIVGDAANGEAEFQSAADGSSWDAEGIVEGRVYITSVARIGITPRKWYAEVEEQ
jgi:hypothetical protein